MGYYAKEDLLLRDAPGDDQRLQVWSDVDKVWQPYTRLRKHLGQNVLIEISATEAGKMKKAGWGPSQPAKAVTQGKRKP